MSNVNWPDVPAFQDGVTSFTEGDMNPIIASLRNRTDILKGLINNSDITNGITMTTTGFSDECIKGMLIAYDTSTQLFVPARAVWGDDSTINESHRMPADTCYVIGILISDIVEGFNQGTLLVSGIITSQALISTILPDKVNGKYYLTADGKMTNDLQSVVLPIYCGSLTGSGYFLLRPQVPDFRTHSHTQHLLDNNVWVSTTSSEGLAYPDKPADATFYYDSKKDPNTATILRELVSTLGLVVNGRVLLDNVDFTLSDGVIWIYYNFNQIDSSAVYVTHPYMGIVSSLSALAPAQDNKVLTITQTGTTAVLDLSFPQKGEFAPGTAITSISNQGVTSAPVVHGLVAGEGITIEPYSEDGLLKTGYTTISNNDARQTLLDINIQKISNVVLSGSIPLTLSFLAGVTASVTGILRIPYLMKQGVGKIFVLIEGTGRAVPAGELRVINQPHTVDGSIPKATVTSYTLPALGTTATNTLYLVEITNNITVAANSLLSVMLTFSNISEPVTVHSLGFKFN